MWGKQAILTKLSFRQWDTYYPAQHSTAQSGQLSPLLVLSLILLRPGLIGP